IAGGIIFDIGGEDVQNRGFPRSDPEPAGGHAAASRLEGVVERAERGYEGPGKVIEGLPIRGEADLRPAALEQERVQLAFQRLNLQGYRWLTQRSLLRGAREAAGLRCQTKATKLLQMPAVFGPGCGEFAHAFPLHSRSLPQSILCIAS